MDKVIALHHLFVNVNSTFRIFEKALQCCDIHPSDNTATIGTATGEWHVLELGEKHSDKSPFFLKSFMSSLFQKTWKIFKKIEKFSENFLSIFQKSF